MAFARQSHCPGTFFFLVLRLPCDLTFWAAVSPLNLPNILIVGHDWQLRPALVRQFAIRGRDCSVVAPGAGVRPAQEELTSDHIVIDVAGLEAVLGTSVVQEQWDVEASEALAGACRKTGAALIQVSHSLVYEWRDRHRWREREEPVANSALGLQLLERERLMQQVEKRLLLRTGHIIGAGRDGLLDRLLKRIRAGGELVLPTEPRQSWTPAADLARVISALVDQLSCRVAVWGTYHYQNAELLTCYDLGERLLAAAEQYWPLPEVTLEAGAGPELPPAPFLDCQRIRNTFGICQRPLGECLDEWLRHRVEEEAL